MIALDRKERLKLPPQTVPKQTAAARVRNWNEVYLGFDLETARREAMRCIQCPAAPCTKACPLENDIPGALLALEEGAPEAAARRFRQTSPMPNICSRLCPQERLCEGSCVVGKRSRPVAIGRLESFVSDFELAGGSRRVPAPARPSGRRVAVIGAGPAGLVVAEELAKRGHWVDVFDAWPSAGGLLSYGIPSFKLDKRRVAEQVAHLERMGVVFRLGAPVDGEDVREFLRDGFDAVFVGHGACASRPLAIPGDDLPGVHHATPFLARLNLGLEQLPPDLREPLRLVGTTVVIGGGDTAMDCARSAIRAGASEVVCVYRRSEAEMPGRAEERRNADEEGVRFEFLAGPVALLPGQDGRVARARFQRMELGPPDASGRARPIPVQGSEFELEAQTIVVAAGYTVDPGPVEGVPGVELTESGTVAADERGATGGRGVFAAGDNVRGADLVVTAVADAKRAAAAMDDYLRSL